MKTLGYLWGSLALCLILIIVLFFRLASLESRIAKGGEPPAGGAAALQDSIHSAAADLAKIKDAMPGLGEHMTTIQLHAGKLWFAVKAANWELAQYELDELKETMEAAKSLNVEKNGVKISNLLDSVLQTQIAALDQSIKRKDQSQFQKSYDETLRACNGCHSEAGYKFIHIVRPGAPPVNNQRWEAAAK